MSPVPPGGAQRGSGMAGRIAAVDWSPTPLGASALWPPHLRATVDLMLAHGFPMIVLWGPQLIQIYNDGYAEILADKHPAGLGQPTEACWPEVWHINGPIYARVWCGETITYLDKLYPLVRNGQLEDVWFTITYSPIRGEDGAIDGVLVTMVETTDAHVAQAARDREQARRRESERRLAMVFNVLPVGVCILDARGQVQTCNDRMRTYLSSNQLPSTDPQILARWKAWHADGSLVLPENYAVSRALRGETVVPGMDFLFTHDDGQARWTQVAAAPLLDADGRIGSVFCIVMDIDALKRAVEHQSVLLSELQHRVRNIMAMINVIALRTRDSADSVDDYAQRLSGRLMSLARTQSLLTRGANAGVCLRGMLDEEITAQGAPAGRYTLRGEDVLLPPKAAEVLSLAIHELASNAARHGALAVEGGHITVAWALVARDGLRWLELRWGEQHRPLPGWQPPQRRGLGAALIEQRVPYELGGSGELRFTAEGAQACLRFPLHARDSLLQTDAPAAAGGSAGRPAVGSGTGPAAG